MVGFVESFVQGGDFLLLCLSSINCNRPGWKMVAPCNPGKHPKNKQNRMVFVGCSPAKLCQGKTFDSKNPLVVNPYCASLCDCCHSSWASANCRSWQNVLSWSFCAATQQDKTSMSGISEYLRDYTEALLKGLDKSSLAFGFHFKLLCWNIGTAATTKNVELSGALHNIKERHAWFRICSRSTSMLTFCRSCLDFSSLK